MPRLGFFTRLLDPADPTARYRHALEQIGHAERLGFDSAWVAQHHFDGNEGGLPSPFLLLAQAGARTTRIRLGTGIVTLPLESPVRVAEDAAVLDRLCDGRLEVGLGTGGNPAAFAAFGARADERHELLDRHDGILRAAWAGQPLPGGNRLYPPAPDLLGRIWIATFSAAGARRAGWHGDGLMLSRTQPRDPALAASPLAALQIPLIDAYLAALPSDAAPRILASRTVFVADDRGEALRHAEAGLRRAVGRSPSFGAAIDPTADLADLLAATDSHIGTADEVIRSLQSDRTLDRVTDLVVQVHPIDPPHRDVLRSIELVATRVAPALGWSRDIRIDGKRRSAQPLEHS
ncbi:MAG: putative FMN-dependent luciferase-like monooxygenase [Lautropia sp.]